MELKDLACEVRIHVRKRRREDNYQINFQCYTDSQKTAEEVAKLIAQRLAGMLGLKASDIWDSMEIETTPEEGE